mmetsp:Transcript_101291/g.326511  ORF Transcript_101291/g.326511 Transcript_101291/m.326511 type:complete len:422 (-) Transcript_101291:94-1359(-)
MCEHWHRRHRGNRLPRRGLQRRRGGRRRRCLRPNLLHAADRRHRRKRGRGCRGNLPSSCARCHSSILAKQRQGWYRHQHQARVLRSATENNGLRRWRGRWTKRHHRRHRRGRGRWLRASDGARGGKLLLLVLRLPLREHRPDHLLDLRTAKGGIRGGPRLRSSDQDISAQLPCGLGVGGRHRRDGAASTDAIHELRNAFRLERNPASAHLVQNATHRPHVRRPRVGLVLADLRAEVVGGPDLRPRACQGVRQDLCDAEVPHAQDVVLGQEEVGGLQIAVQDVPVMQMLQCQDRLREPPENPILGQGLVGPAGNLDFAGELPALAEVHEDTQHALVREALPVADDVGMLQRRKQLCLLHCIFCLLAASPADINHLADSSGTALRRHQDRTAVRALADLLDLREGMPREQCRNALLCQRRHGP